MVLTVTVALYAKLNPPKQHVNWVANNTTQVALILSSNICIPITHYTVKTFALSPNLLQIKTEPNASIEENVGNNDVH